MNTISPTQRRRVPRTTSRSIQHDTLQKAFVAAFVLCLAVLPLDFIPGVQIEGYYVKYLYIATLGMFAFAPFLLPGSTTALRMVGLLTTAYFVRFAILLISLAWSHDRTEGITTLMIDAVSFGLSMPLCLMASRLTLARLAAALAWGAFAGAAFFHLFVLAGHAMAGRNGLSILFDLLITGEFRNIKLNYFVGALRGLGVQGISGVWGTIAPKITNAFGHSLITPAIAAVHLVTADKLINRRGGRLRDWAARIALINAVFVALMAFSTRVQIYGAVLVLAHAFYFGTLHGNKLVRFSFFYLSVLTIFLFVIYFSFNVTVQGGVDDFAIQFINDPRFNDFYVTIDRIMKVGLLGDGFGTPLGMISLTGNLFPHNLFMSDFLAVGVLGLFAALVWFGRLTFLALNGLRLAMERKSSVAVQRMGLAAFVILTYSVLLTQLTSRGMFDLSDWVGMFIGIVVLAKAIEYRTGVAR